MKKIHGLFLYCMLAFTPIYSISIAEIFLSALCGTVVTKGYELAQTRFSFSALELVGLNKSKDIAVHYLSVSLASMRYGMRYVGSGFGICKSVEQLEEETIKKQEAKAQADFEKKAKVLKEEYELKIDRALFEQKQTHQLEIDKLKNELINLTNKQEINETKNALIKKHNDEMNKTISQYEAEKKLTTATHMEILKTKIKTLSSELERVKKELEKATKKEISTASPSFLATINSYTVSNKHSADVSSFCPQCKYPINFNATSQFLSLNEQ